MAAKLTAAEYAAAVRRAHTECEQEIAAAKAEYKEAVRPIARRRKERGKAARARRDGLVAELHGELR